MRRIHVDSPLLTEVEEPKVRWAEGSFRRILVAFNGSQRSWKALRMGISLAWQHDAELWALSVEDHLPGFAATLGEVQEEKEREDHYYQELYDRAKALAECRGVRLNSAIVPGRAARTIVCYAKEGGFDIIVIGSSAHGGLWEALLSTTGGVSRGAPCTVMIVR